MSFKRKFTEKDIQYVLDFIKPVSYLPIEISESNAERIKLNIKGQIIKCEIYPEIIPIFKNELEKAYNKALIQSGEMIGILSATYIAEIVTQLTLNSFHFAGISSFSIASGVPRLQELLNCTKIIKQPSMTLYLKSDLQEQLEKERKNNELCETEYRIYREIEEVTLFELLDKKFLTNGDEKNNDFKIQKPQWSYYRELTDLEEQWYEVYYELHNDTVRENEYAYSIRLIFDKDKLYEKNISLLEIAKKIEIFRDLYCVVSSDVIGIIDVYVDCDRIDIPVDNDFIDDDNKSIFYIENTVIDYLLDLLVKGIDGIKNIYFKKEDNKWITETDGSNLTEIFANDNFDHSRILTNDIWEIYKTLGIEAARNAFIIEFKKVMSGNFIFDCYITNLCNSMTHTGKLTSVSRYGIDKQESGPLTVASFEEPFKCLLDAGINQRVEEIEGVSSCVITGQLSKIGTGSFDLLYNINQVKEKPFNLLDCLKTDKKFVNDKKKEVKKIIHISPKKEEKKIEKIEFDFSSSSEDETDIRSRSPSPVITKKKKKSFSKNETIGKFVIENQDEDEELIMKDW